MLNRPDGFPAMGSASIAFSRSRVLGTRVLAFAVAASIALAACGGSSGSAPSTATEWTTVFEGESTLNGTAFEAAGLGGTPTVLWFWAPWCTVCRVEGPKIAEIAAERAADVRIIGIAGRGEIPAMQEFVDATATGSFDHVVDADGSIWSEFGVFAQPAFAFIDADGAIEVFVGSLPARSLIERIDALVAV